MDTDQYRTRSKRQADASAVSAHIEIAAMTDLTIWEEHYRQVGQDEQGGVLSILTYFSHLFNLVRNFFILCFILGIVFNHFRTTT